VIALPLARRVAAPLTGVAALLITGALISLVPPTPRPTPAPVSAPASGG